ncbi:esterase-like activity of phytase family protein [Trichothermofontia sichuanensis B231]|uniref:esterase-like activity of phytase family protein n=1 Tax=Trichothermofontia sichuanensis TaxID=3045816 RepID=UPI002246EF02|nr:esterase-like activity of phytase family protein [Trichothermofontia sichuanensis]UZQ53174.1 esterase-like activity of phytase family protein [Trichothermofontia sichuanensis B231]
MNSFRAGHRLGRYLVLVLLCGLLGACGLPQVKAIDRLFLKVNLTFLDATELPAQQFDKTPVGGLSAITYDRQRDRYYVLSDDRSDQAPARFYTLQIDLDMTQPDAPAFGPITIEAVTSLQNELGDPYAPGSLDPEGIALTPQDTLWISSEGVSRDGIEPFISEFELATGRWRRSLPIPQRFRPHTKGKQVLGIRDNLGFESLTVSPIGTVASQGEPLRLFTATEAALSQDWDPNPPANSEAPPRGDRTRLLHYYIGEGPPLLIAEHLYPLDPPPPLALAHGLVELLALDQGGHFLALERSFGGLGFGAKLFQITLGGASDITPIASLKDPLPKLTPIRKQLLLDLSDLDLVLDNLEGMTLGPQLPNGHQSLLLISDNNFSENQTTQLLLFELSFN